MTHARGTVTVVLTGFSRGNASAAIFSQMLFKRGVVDSKSPNEVLIQPGQVTISAGVLYDPVMTGVGCNLAFAPNARNLVQIRAQDEYRNLFRAADYSAQSCIRRVDMLGSHCDIGGGRDHGIAALTLDAATRFFRKSGLPIDDVDKARRFAGVDAIDIHSEEYKNEKPKEDKTGFLWDVYWHFESVRIKDKSPRESVVVAHPATESTSGGTTVRTMILYDGQLFSLARPPGKRSKKPGQLRLKRRRTAGK